MASLGHNELMLGKLSVQANFYWIWSDGQALFQTMCSTTLLVSDESFISRTTQCPNAKRDIAPLLTQLSYVPFALTHWGRVMHICVNKLTIIGSDNVLSPGQRQAIIWTKAGILSIGPLGTNFDEILIKIQTFSFKEMHLKMSSGNGGHFVPASMC